jgi:tetratricopeptide (TPR) repeat protein
MKARFLVIGLLSLAILWSCKGQDSSVNKGKRLYQEAFRLEESNRPEDLRTAAEKYEAARKIFEKAESYELLCSTLYNLGGVYRRLGNGQKSVECFREALTLAKKTNDSKMAALVSRNLNVVQSKPSPPETPSRPTPLSAPKDRLTREGIKLFNEALVLRQTAKSNDDLEKAVERYEQAQKIFEKEGDQEKHAATLNNLGAVYWHWGQYDKAVEYYEKSLTICRELKDRKGEGQALNNLGAVYSDWGQYAKAVDYYEKSLAICRELKDRRGEGATLNNLGAVYSDWGQYDKAVEYYEKSLAICRELKDRKEEGATLNNLGAVYWHWGQYDKAVEYYEKSLAICRELKDRKGEGQSLSNLGLVSCRWGQYDKAAEYCEKSLAICRDLKDRKGESQSLNNLGAVFYNWGQYDKAVDYYEKSLAIFRDLKDRKGEGQSLNNLGLVYSDWGQYDKAVEYYEKSLAIFRELKDRKGESQSLNNLGAVFHHWGQYDKAVDYYEKSLAIKRDLKDRRGEGLTILNVGRVFQHSGEHQKALENFQKGLAIYTEIKVPTEHPKAFIADQYMDMGDLAKAEPLLREANYNSDWGRFYLLKLDYPKAKEYYGRILKSAEENRNADILFTAYTGIGVACESLNEDASAAEHYEKAVKFTEEIRSSLSASEREKFFDVKIKGFTRTAPYEGLARVQMRQNKPQDAFKTTEYTRARVFAEAMTRLSAGKNLAVPAEIVKQDDSLNNELASLKKNLQKAFEKNNKLVIQSLEPQVKQLEGKLQAHIKMLREKYPLFAATKYPQPMDLSQTALKDSEWVISYDVTDPGILIYLTKATSLVNAWFKPVPRKEIDDLARKFREPLEVKEGRKIGDQLKDFDFASGKRLADILLSDVLPLLPKDSPVIIVPGGSLGIVPFEMLVLNDGGRVATDKPLPYVVGADFFGDRFPVSYCQSVTALTLARNYPKLSGSQKQMLVMADPVFELNDKRAQAVSGMAHLPSEEQRSYGELYKELYTKTMGGSGSLRFLPLPLSGKLAEDIGKIYQGDCHIYTGLQASKRYFMEQIKPKLSEYNQVVFASHGYFGTDLPGIKEPVLVLTLVPPGTDGYLRMSEVMGLSLNADMVALTACQTGVGQRLSGEGTMGMGRAFQYAGAKSVLMSLWIVAEESSVKLVESFFKHRKDNKSKLEALQLARKEVRDQGYDHPFFWAPFILVGEVD